MLSHFLTVFPNLSKYFSQFFFNILKCVRYTDNKFELKTFLMLYAIGEHIFENLFFTECIVL